MPGIVINISNEEYTALRKRIGDDDKIKKAIRKALLAYIESDLARLKDKKPIEIPQWLIDQSKTKD